jgi:hypothetical protein
MAVANTLAYYVTATITAVKSFIVQAPAVTSSAFLTIDLLILGHFKILSFSEEGQPTSKMWTNGTGG